VLRNLTSKSEFIIMDIERITITCSECFGAGQVCSECGEGMEGFNHRCDICNKFVHIEYCNNCMGSGYVSYTIGDEVSVFVCIHNYNELDGLYEPKKYDDFKTFTGKIKGFTDNKQKAVIDIKYNRNNPYLIPVDEIEHI